MLSIKSLSKEELEYIYSLVQPYLNNSSSLTKITAEIKDLNAEEIRNYCQNC